MRRPQARIKSADPKGRSWSRFSAPHALPRRKFGKAASGVARPEAGTQPLAGDDAGRDCKNVFVALPSSTRRNISVEWEEGRKATRAERMRRIARDLAIGGATATAVGILRATSSCETWPLTKSPGPRPARSLGDDFGHESMRAVLNAFSADDQRRVLSRTNDASDVTMERMACAGTTRRIGIAVRGIAEVARHFDFIVDAYAGKKRLSRFFSRSRHCRARIAKRDVAAGACASEARRRAPAPPPSTAMR